MTAQTREGWHLWPVLNGVSVGLVLGLVGVLSIWDKPSPWMLWGCAALLALLGGLWSYAKVRFESMWVSRIGFGVLVTLVLAHTWLITIQALPAPGGGMNKRDWKSATVQGEFRAWTERLNGLGIDIEQEDLEERLWDLAVGVMAFRKQSLLPMYRYYKNAGTWQSWRMFVAPHRYPSRLHVEVRINGTWTPMYVARSSEHDWRAYQLDHDRFRAALFRYGWGRKYPGQWRGFGDWMAREAERDFPEADAIRLKFWSYRTLSPEETRAGVEEDGRWIRTRVVKFGVGR